MGSGQGVDIAVQGTGVEPIHCHIDNQGGVVTLIPQSEMTSVDQIRVSHPTRLSQGRKNIIMLLMTLFCNYNIYFLFYKNYIFNGELFLILTVI